MRIVQVAPLARPVAPDTPSSIEQVVRVLVDALLDRGHQVTLFASGDSRSRAEVVGTYPRSYRADPRLWTHWQHHEAVHCADAIARSRGADVVHSHVYAFPAPLCRLVDVPVLHTDHCPPEPALLHGYAAEPRLTVVALSAYHRSRLAPVTDAPVVLNGVDVAAFPFRDRPSPFPHLLFLGHLEPRKGAVEAVRVAERAGVPIVLAGRGDGDYYDAEVRPLLRPGVAEHVGPVTVAERDERLASASALVFTSLRAEPFGLVLVEAMACGTPVLALRRCAVPEIVDEGVTGFSAPDVAALAALVPAALALDRARVRERAVERFSAERMAADYERLYVRAAGHHAVRSSRAW